jgi:hypothetical protein
MLHAETVTNENYIPRVTDLEQRGGFMFRIKVLAHNLGYEIQCTLPDEGERDRMLQAELFKPST